MTAQEDVSNPSSSHSLGEKCPIWEVQCTHLQPLATSGQHLALGISVLHGHPLRPPPAPLQALCKHALGDPPARQQACQACCGQCSHDLHLKEAMYNCER